MAAFRIPIKWDPGVVMYLIIKDKLIRDYAALLKQRPTEKFFGMVHDLVMDCVLEGKAPPAEVSGAIMNIADDVMAGRDASIRAGDYIALMNFAKAQKKL